MAIYEYRAVDPLGKTVSGTVNEKTKHDAFASLKKQGLVPISVKETKKKAVQTKKDKKPIVSTQSGVSTDFADRFRNIDFKELGSMDIMPEKVTSKDYAVFCRQAYTMLNAGMSIIASLQVLSMQIENKTLRTAVGKVVLDLQKGYPFSTCLRMYPKVFPTLFVNMIEAGELTGNIDGVLDSLAKQYERDHEINSQVKKATLYPKAVGLVAVIVVMLLLIFVVPTFVEMFEDSGTPLPQVTQNLIAMSEFVQAYWYVIFMIIAGFFITIDQIKKHETSKFYYDTFINKIPVIGKAVVKITTARFARTSATLLQSGIPIIAAIKSAAQVSGNSLVIRGVDDVSDEIRAGQSLSLMLNKLEYFPPMMISMVSIGEESGDIVGLLDKTADYYEQEMKEAIDTLTGLIEPAMIVFLSVVVGYVVIAILLPVLDMSKTVQI